MTVSVRRATRQDAAAIHGLIVALADYEKLRHELVADAAATQAALFGAAPRVYCDVAELDGAVAGMAIWFYDYSTFRGRHGVYLEDLFVRPEARGRGAGKALLAALARLCLDEDLCRLNWRVLDWNEPSIGFYRTLGTAVQPEWLPCRLEGPALERLAAAAP